MDLEKVLSRLSESPGYHRNADRVRDIMDESEERDTKALRQIADEALAKRKV